MDVVLDTNIFRSDILLRSKDFEILLDYLMKTESSIKLPQVIFDEILGVYKRTLKDRQSELEKVVKNINLSLSDAEKQVAISVIDIEGEVDNYSRFIRKKLKIHDRQIIPYNNDFLPEISHRLIERHKPANDKGYGFRDTLIWLTLKDICKKCHEKQIVFISDNSGDFSDTSKKNLHESLVAECQADGVKVNYYRSLKDFIDKHSNRIDFINDQWVTENIDFQSISELAMDDLNSSEKRGIMSWFYNKTGGSCERYNVIGIEYMETDNPTVYEMADNSLIVNINIQVELEVEFTYSSDEPIWDDDRNYADYITRYTTTIHYVPATLYITITLTDNEVGVPELNMIDI